MKVLILAAGYGTRLGTISENTAKGLLNVGDQPIIDYIIDHVRDLSQLKEVIVVTNEKYCGDFEQWANDHNEKESFKIHVISDGTKSNDDRLGSIGDIDFILKNIKIDDDLLVIGGDNLFDFNIDEYVQFAQAQPDHVSVGLYDIKEREQATKFGVVELGEDGRIASFEEKPENPKSSLIAMCLYYFPKKTLGFIGDYLLQSGKSDQAGDYIIWLNQNYDVYGFEFSGKWFDIGSVESYNEAQEAFTSN